IRGPQEGKADAAGQKTTNPAPATKLPIKTIRKKPASCGLFAFQKVEASIQDAATGSGSFSSIHSEPGILLPVLYPGHSLSP
ncbi:hypothetical protein ACCS41_10700, partial [Rhizobium johnstonii]